MIGALVGAPIRHAQVFERHRIEIVVGERDEAEAETPQLHQFLDHRIRLAHARLLAVGAPHRTERTVLGTAAHGLHRRDHVLVARQQVPARLQHRGAFDLAALVDPLRFAGFAVGNHHGPDAIAVALDHGMSAAVFERLVREQARVNAAVHDVGAALAGRAADFVAAQGVEGVDPDPDDVARRHGVHVDLLERFVDHLGIAKPGGRSRGKHIEPAWRNHRGAKSHVAGIDEVDAHVGAYYPRRNAFATAGAS